VGRRDAAEAGAEVVDEAGRMRLGGYGTIDLRGGLDASALEPICSAMSGS
jgi:hypothetical protein